ncbi:MAG: hypothetical protein ACRD3Q_13575 [Terriglobales bacterium]
MYGLPPKNTHTLPAGRRSFTETAAKPPDVVRPSHYADGQDQAGTPPGRESTVAGRRAYADGAAYRQDLRGSTSRGTTGRPESKGPNPTVHSKSTKRYGRDGSRLEGATHKSTGDQPAPLDRSDEVPASLPAHHMPGGTAHTEVVGFAPDGSGRHIPASHPNTQRHVGGVHQDTNRPRGMADKA